jgi:hypothetical protein
MRQEQTPFPENYLLSIEKNNPNPTNRHRARRTIRRAEILKTIPSTAALGFFAAGRFARTIQRRCRFGRIGPQQLPGQLSHLLGRLLLDELPDGGGRPHPGIAQPFVPGQRRQFFQTNLASGRHRRAHGNEDLGVGRQILNEQIHGLLLLFGVIDLLPYP